MLIGQDTARPRTLEELLPAELCASLDRLDVFSRKVFAGKLPGERRSKRRGRSVEFDDFRPYVPGDDPRHIDWRVYARLDRLVLKLFREDEDLSLDIALDISASMDAGVPSKLVTGARLAMALAYVGLATSSRVSVSVVGDGVSSSGLRRLAPVRGKANLSRIAGFLLESIGGVKSGAPADAASAGGPSLVRSLRALAATRSGKGVMVVISDFLTDEPMAGALSYLAGGDGGGFDVHCLQVLSPGEADPASERERGLLGDLRLTDAETGAARDVTISAPLIARYVRLLTQHNERLKRECLGRGIAHYSIRSDTSVVGLVLGTLRRGGMLR